MRTMNGKPFVYFSYSDYGQPGRKSELGKHTGLEEASRAYWRALHPVYEKIHGYKVWLEDANGQRVNFLPRRAVMSK